MCSLQGYKVDNVMITIYIVPLLFAVCSCCQVCKKASTVVCIHYFIEDCIFPSGTSTLVTATNFGDRLFIRNERYGVHKLCNESSNV